MCRPHWYQVPAGLRAEFFQIARTVRSGEGETAALDVVINQAVEAVEELEMLAREATP